jgi:tetratricopeptide (TPR) repeat protein
VAFPRAEVAARRAIELDPQLAEGHSSLGYVLSHWHWDWPGSERSFQRSIELDRGYASAHQWYGILLACRGRFDEAIAHGLEAVRLDPLSRVLYSTVGDSYYYARRYEEAIAIYRQAIDFSPDFIPVRFDLGRSLEQAGRYQEALTEFEIGLGLSGGDRATSAGLACTYGFSGRPDLARPILAGLIAKSARQYVPPYAIASVHVALGQIDQALEWLERAYAARDRAMIYVGVNPRFDSLRDAPRYQVLVDRMRLFA